MLMIDEEDKALVDILNIMNVSLVKNRWAPPIQSSVETIKRLYKAMAEEIYVGAAVKKAQNKEGVAMLERLMLFYNGPPVVRI